MPVPNNLSKVAELRREILAYLLRLEHEEAFRYLETIEDYIKKKFDGETLRIGIAMLTLLRDDLNYLRRGPEWLKEMFA